MSKVILPTVIVRGELDNGKQVTIFGEDHNDISNSFYENLDLSNKNLWVEHATVLCDLKKGEEKLYQNAKGSEWIWFTSKKIGRKVTCIDNRIENGLLSAIKENQLSHSEDYMKCLMTIGSTLPKYQKIKQDFIPAKEYYTKFVSAIFRQLKVLDKALKSNLPQFKKLLPMIKDVLVYNIIKFSSLSVDMHIIKLLNKYKENKDIYIFTGAAHALRIAQLLNYKILNGEEHMEEYGKLYPEEDEEKEEKLLAL